MKKLGIYLHIPFCLSKCRYCDFYSIPGASEELKDRYVKALVNHMKEYGHQAKDYIVDTVYFGGGTPSLLSEKQLKTLMKALKSNFRIYGHAEISMEINPKTADLSKLKCIRRCGINRLSIGVQSFGEHELEIAGRAHSADDAFETVRLARKAGFGNISLDLMFGMPSQSLQSVVDNVNTAISLDVEHISLYGLKIEEGTPFWHDRNKLMLPDEDEERSMYFSAGALLSAAGLKQYEISNFSKRGKHCKHNLKYWNCDEYLGFGPGAHSYFAGKRFSFKKDINLYTDSFDETKNVTDTLIDEYIDIPYPSRVAEYVMLRFRLNTGISVAAFYKRFGRDFDEMYLSKMMPFINSGHILKTKNGYAFSREGMYVSNYILSRIVDFDLIIPGA